MIPLTPLPKLPHNIELPSDIPVGMVALGMQFNGQHILVSWSKLGHLMIIGMTGSGKSSLLRSLVVQAIRNSVQLALADIDQTTFAMFEKHPNLFAPIATSPQDALTLILKVLGECDHRAALYKSMTGYPETIDEYNALAVKSRQVNTFPPSRNTSSPALSCRQWVEDRESWLASLRNLAGTGEFWNSFCLWRRNLQRIW